MPSSAEMAISPSPLNGSSIAHACTPTNQQAASAPTTAHDRRRSSPCAVTAYGTSTAAHAGTSTLTPAIVSAAAYGWRRRASSAAAATSWAATYTQTGATTYFVSKFGEAISRAVPAAAAVTAMRTSTAVGGTRKRRTGVMAES
jgi:Tfp pilus assembly protein PilW